MLINNTTFYLSFYMLAATLLLRAGCSRNSSSTPPTVRQELFKTTHFTSSGTFTSGAEGPAVAPDGMLYAVNFKKQQTIGQITPHGETSVFLELTGKSTGNGIRFNSKGDMLVADYVNHNILKIDMNSRDITVFAHDDRMNQPNDIAITSDDVLFASDPDWKNQTGQLWKIDSDGKTTLLENNMGTTNGIEVSTDEKKLYVNESIQRKIWVYDLTDAKMITNKRLFYEFTDYGMDGMRCDVKGNLYVTRHGKGTVVILSPEGKKIREVSLAEGKNVTNIAFGGKNGKQVFLTVADVGNIQTFMADQSGRNWVLYKQNGLLNIK